MPQIDLSFASKEDSLSVRRFTVAEGVSRLFEVHVVARSPNDDIDLEAIVGKPAGLRIVSGVVHATKNSRVWTGVCSFIQQVQAEPTGLSTYEIRIAPALWLLTKRVGHRLFQHLSIPDIVKKLLGEWAVEAKWKIDDAAYPKLELVVQYGETDFAFVSRLLEEAGIAYFFADDDAASHLTFGDDLPHGEARPGAALHYVDNPNQAAEKEFVTHVHVSHEVRPGKYTIREYDFRKPGFALFGEAPAAPAPEDAYEQYHYLPGSFLAETGKGGDTPVADDKGATRADEKLGKQLATRGLERERASKRNVFFETNVVDLRPGVIFSIDHHPHRDIAKGKKLLVVEASLSGSYGGEWQASGSALLADQPYRPPAKTPRPQIHSVQSALVVGPAGQEIHTDEFGRVRVQFPWDREGKNDDNSSCWIRVSQGWAGSGFGLIALPRIGQEVLIGFVDGDPDQPVVVGRVFNAARPVPYKLPDHKTVSTWKSDSSPHSGGFNEIKFEDLAGQELVYVQAEKDLHKLVKHDENETTGNDRTIIVEKDLTTHVVNDWVELCDNDRVSVVKKDVEDLVKGNLVERVEKTVKTYVGETQDIQIKKTKKELIESESHLHVKGDLHEKFDGAVSLTIGGGRDTKIAKSDALEVGKEIHLKAGTKVIIEAASMISLVGPGGFVTIDSGGVYISGSMVKINSGGSAGSGTDAKPVDPKDAEEAKIKPPDPPEDFSDKK